MGNKPKKKKMMLTNRDWEILLFLWEWKVISTGGIAVQFFSKASKARTYQRLTMLEKEGYIAKAYVGWSCKFA